LKTKMRNLKLRKCSIGTTVNQQVQDDGQVGFGMNKNSSSKVLDELSFVGDAGLGKECTEIAKSGGNNGVDEGFSSRRTEAGTEWGDIIEVEVLALVIACCVIKDSSLG